MSKKKAKVPVHAGIDVAKGMLDICVLQDEDERLLAPKRVTNDEKGAAECIKHLTQYNVKLIVLEATGGYENLIAMKLQGPSNGPLSCPPFDRCS